MTGLAVNSPIRSRERWVILGFVALAAAIRLPAVFRELPPYLFCDEGIFLDDVRGQLASGTFGASDFRSGGVNIYPVVLLWRAAALLGLGTPGDTALVISARLLLTVGLGAGTVIFVYLAARELSGRRSIAAVAAAAWVLSPFVLAVSRYWYPDHYVAFFSAALVFVAMRLLTRGPSWARFAWFGVAWGLAAGTKYSGAFLGVVLVVVVIALWVRAPRGPEPARFRLTLALQAMTAAGAAAMAFLLANWSVLVSPHRFQEDFIFNVRHYSTSGDTSFADGLPFNLFATFALTAGVTAVIPYMLGYVRIWTRSRAMFWLLVSMPTVLAVYLATNTLTLHRNMGIAVPFVLPVLAVGVVALWDLFRERRRIASALAGLALLLLTGQVAWASTASLARDFRPDTRVLAYDWISAQVPPSVAIGVNEFCSGPSPARVAGRPVAIDPQLREEYPYYVLDSYWPSVLSDAYFTRDRLWWLRQDQRYAHFYGFDDTSIMGRVDVPSLTSLVPHGFRIAKVFSGSGPEVVVLQKVVPDGNRGSGLGASDRKEHVSP